jgi:hypothetical protein
MTDHERIVQLTAALVATTAALKAAAGLEPLTAIVKIPDLEKLFPIITKASLAGNLMLILSGDQQTISRMESESSNPKPSQPEPEQATSAPRFYPN